MLVVGAQPVVQLVLTVSPILLAGAYVLLLGCVVALTVAVLRLSRAPWRDDGRPVFKRLPNGRTQFSWGVATGLAEAQRSAEPTARARPARDSGTEPGTAGRSGQSQSPP